MTFKKPPKYQEKLANMLKEAHDQMKRIEGMKKL
jgi:hypothetical protein